MKKLINKFMSSSMLKNVARISTGTIIGQLVSMLSLPILTRIYGDKIIGDWTFLNTIALLVNAVSDFGLTNALMMERNDEDMLQTYKVVTTIVFGISIFVAILAFLYYGILSPSSIIISPIFVAVFLMIAVFTLQQTQICYTWLNRQTKYDVLMKNPIINNAMFGGVAILLGFIGIKEYGYYLGWVIGQIITLMHMKRYLPKGFFSFKWGAYKSVFTRNKHFVVYQLPTNMITQAKNQLPTLLIKLFFGANILGQYAITVRVINIPINLLGTSIGRVFFQKSSEMKLKGEPVGDFTYRNITRVMKIAIVPVMLIMAFGDVAFNFVLGSGWQMAGDMVRILALQSFFTFLMMASQGISITIDKQNYAVVSAAVQAIGITISLAVGAYVFNSIYIGTAILSISYIIINIVYFCALFRVMNVNYKKYLRHVFFHVIIISIGYLFLRLPLLLLGAVPSM